MKRINTILSHIRDQRFIYCILLFALWIYGCSVNPVTQKREFVLMSQEQEISLGKKMDPEIQEEYGIYDDSSLQSYVSSIGMGLAKESDRPGIAYHFKVLSSPVVNAFALPGGYIYITRGIMAYLNSEAELAGVLGHEIGHVTARHAAKELTKALSYEMITGIAGIIVPELRQLKALTDIMAQAILRGYGRDAEIQSDLLSIKYIERLNYDPFAVPSFLESLLRMEKESGKEGYHGLFATHPETSERIKKSTEEAKNISSSLKKNRYFQSKDPYLSRINGLIFGQDPREGLVEKNLFRHAFLKIEIVFPSGFSIQNMASKVIASDPKNARFMEFKAEPSKGKGSLSSLMREVSRKLKARIVDGESTRIHGLEAYIATFEGRTEEIGPVQIRYSLIKLGERIFHLYGIAPLKGLRDSFSLFDKTIFSFRELTQQEIVEIKTQKITVYKVKGGDTLDSILKARGITSSSKDILLLNGMDKSSDIKPGTSIKLISSD